METKIWHPKSAVLKQYIQYFLFIVKNNRSSVSQICYPNTNHCFSLLENSRIHQNDNNSYYIIASPSHNSYLTGIYKSPISIESKIPYRELCINFTPLGLETIFDQKLSSYIFQQDPLKQIKNFDWNILSEIVFKYNSIENIQNELEDFLLSKIRDENLKYPTLYLNGLKGVETIEEICDHMFKSYRSTHRYFKDQFALSPKDFLQIKKVRSAMDKIIENEDFIDITYNLDFTDQSHFTKTFKKYTNKTPLEFKNSALAIDNILIWNLE